MGRKSSQQVTAPYHSPLKIDCNNGYWFQENAEYAVKEKEEYENGKVRQVEVKVGATNLPYTEISSPEIKEGDKIVVKGLFGLQDNDNVEIKNGVNK